MAEKNKETDNSPSLMEIMGWIANPIMKGIGWLSHQYAEPAVSAAEDVVRRNVVVPIQKSVGVTPKSVIKTERNFNQDFLNTLDSIAISQLDIQAPDWRERTERGDTVRINVRGKDYTTNYGGTDRSIKERLTNPLHQIETTIGDFGVEATKDDLLKLDTYDWNTKVHLNENTRYGWLRNKMNYLGTPDTAPENEKIQIRINSKRKDNDN